MSTRLAFLAFLPLALGCSWGRFDDVTEETPVVLLHKPGELKTGFGVSLATTMLASKVRLLSAGGTGPTPAAVFDLGATDRPTLDASQKGYCGQAQGNTCFFGLAAAGVPRFRVGRDLIDLCFVMGVGKFDPDSGLLVRCANNTEFVLPVIPEAQSVVDDSLAILDPELAVLAADRDPEFPAIAAALPDSQLAWYYGPDSSEPRPLAAPSGAATPRSYGRTVSVLKLGGAKRVIAIGAPDEGRVYLFASDDPSRTWPIGCLGETENFGRSLAAGSVDVSGDDDLVIADASNVHVFDGTALGSLPVTTSSDCSLGGLPGGALIASFSCGSNGAVAGCASADFGKAVAVGDIDGDGDGEVMVGAPGMEVRDVSRAGAVLVYDVEGGADAKHRLSEIKFLSSAEDQDGLGASLATPWLGSKHVIAAGAPGGGKTALFYCSSLIPASKRSARCQ